MYVPFSTPHAHEPSRWRAIPRERLGSRRRQRGPAEQRRLRFESLEQREVLSGNSLSAPDPDISLVAAWPDATYLSNPTIDSGFHSETIALHGAETDREWQLVAEDDFNGDGVPDLMGQGKDGTWRLRVNDGMQVFELPWGDALPKNAEHLGIADFNDDGLTDIASFDSSTGKIWISINSLGGFRHEQWAVFSTSTTWTTLEIGDFDHDGLPDLLGGETTGSWWLAKNHLGATFRNTAWGSFPNANWQNIAVGNFTDDEFLDVAGRAADNTWWVWSGDENGFRPANYWGHWRARDSWFDVNVADFNGDGRDDLVSRTEDGLIWVTVSKANSFQNEVWGSGWTHAAGWSHVSARDMNADGTIDLVGHAADDTWWFAANDDGKFRNYFWQRYDERNTVIVSDFQRDNAVDLSSSLLAGNVSSQSSEPEIVLGSDNRLEFNGRGHVVQGLELSSASGSLVPADRESQKAPFSNLLYNTPHLIVLANLPEPLQFDERVTLGIGWNERDRDLVVRFGTHTAVNATVDVILNDTARLSTAEQNFSIFHSGR